MPIRPGTSPHTLPIRARLWPRRPGLSQECEQSTKTALGAIRSAQGSQKGFAKQNDNMSLDVASRICNSYLLSQTDQLISFAFHESTTVIEATKEAKKLDMLVTVLYLD